MLTSMISYVRSRRRVRRRENKNGEHSVAMRLTRFDSCRILSTGAVLLLMLIDGGNSVQDDELADNVPESQMISAMSDEKKLIKHLLDNYEGVGVVGRPVFNTSSTIRVNFGLALIQILDLDEKNQVLTTNVWSRYVWNDTLLTWNPDDYGGVSYVRVPIAKIWTPDIVLYNYADTRLREHREAMAVVSNYGSVLWIPPSIFRSSCPIDITHFPFDVQTCHLKFGSWTYDGFKLDLAFYDDDEQVDTSNYIESNEWELIDHPAKRNVRYYACCIEPYPDLTFTITIKRVAVFYSYILVLPCLLLSFITLVIFWLPPESPAKMMLGMNVFVAFFVLLLLLADNTPPAASTIPLIGAYFCMNMILITLSSFLAIVVINTHIRGDRKNRVPDWLRRITIDGLARVLCMNEYLDDKDKMKKTSPSKSNTPTVTRSKNAADSKSRVSVKVSGSEKTSLRTSAMPAPSYGEVSNSSFQNFQNTDNPLGGGRDKLREDNTPSCEEAVCSTDVDTGDRTLANTSSTTPVSTPRGKSVGTLRNEAPVPTPCGRTHVRPSFRKTTSEERIELFAASQQSSSGSGFRTTVRTLDKQPHLTAYLQDRVDDEMAATTSCGFLDGKCDVGLTGGDVLRTELECIRQKDILSESDSSSWCEVQPATATTTAGRHPNHNHHRHYHHLPHRYRQEEREHLHQQLQQSRNLEPLDTIERDQLDPNTLGALSTERDLPEVLRRRQQMTRRQTMPEHVLARRANRHVTSSCHHSSDETESNTTSTSGTSTTTPSTVLPPQQPTPPPPPPRRTTLMTTAATTTTPCPSAKMMTTFSQQQATQLQRQPPQQQSPQQQRQQQQQQQQSVQQQRRRQQQPQQQQSLQQQIQHRQQQQQQSLQQHPHHSIDLKIRASPAMESDLNEIRSMLNLYMKRLDNKDMNAKVTKEWRVVARVFDRLFFYTYCATILVSLATIFPRAHD